MTLKMSVIGWELQPDPDHSRMDSEATNGSWWGTAAAVAVLVPLVAGCCITAERVPTHEPPPRVAAPDMAEPPPSPVTPDGGAKTPAEVPAKPELATPAPAKPAPTKPAPAKPTTAKPAPPPAPLDLKSLEQRLRDSSAIGVFTKLALKNQVDDLLDQFRAHHQGKPKPALTELRPAYERLLLKVLSLLQDSDPMLAHDIVASREAIWNILVDRNKFNALI